MKPLVNQSRADSWEEATELRYHPDCRPAGDTDFRRLRLPAACAPANLMLSCHNLPSFQP
jgi:hypothetical protein